MSMNNFANRSRSFEMRAPRAISVGEAFSLAHEEALSAKADRAEFDRLAAKAAKRAENIPKLGEGERYISAQALLGMAERAGLDRWEAVYHLPFGAVDRDFAAICGGVWNPVTGMKPEEIARYARFFGFLAACKSGEFRGLKKLGEDHRLVRSFHVPCAPWREAEKEAASLWLRLFSICPSPGRLEKLLMATRREAAAITAAWHGLPPYFGWAASAKALAATGCRPRQAAITLLAMARGWRLEEVRGAVYRSARDWLAANRGKLPIIREDDGVRAHAARTPCLIEGEVSVYTATFSRQGEKASEGWLICAGDRTYHFQNTCYKETSDDALVAALAAWKRQDENRLRLEAQAKAAAQAVAELTGFLDGTLSGICPLIRREDSYRAGNCSPGTEE